MIVKCDSHIKNKGEIKIEYDAIEECPKCNRALAPERLYSIVIDN